MVYGYANLNWVTPQGGLRSGSFECRTSTSMTTMPENRFFYCLSSDFWNLPQQHSLILGRVKISEQAGLFSDSFTNVRYLLAFLFARIQTGSSYVSKPHSPCGRKMTVSLRR